MAKPKVGFIGLGYMGRPMCRNLLTAGFEVSVWKRSRPGIEYAVSYGAVEVSSAAEVASRSDIVVTMLKHGGDVSEVALGSHGFLDGARPGLVVLDTTTISPSEARSIAASLSDKGVLMLDAPVSGSTVKAESGTLSIMIGGPSEALERCGPVLEVIGENIVHIGEENGAGQGAKLCNQVLVLVNLLATCEALTLGAALGLDNHRVYEAVKSGAAGSWQFEHMGARILAGDLEPGGTVETVQKDLGILMNAARELHMPLPASALVHQLYNAVEAEGMGKKGHQALVAAYEMLSGVHVAEVAAD
ncbi:MAG: NAD(P)-dependent oxidoreductase [Dehalococcoidia bacterium]|nr:NAD(P)-dependent oxidoreductase [Dehalococcoidia bacterium]